MSPNSSFHSFLNVIFRIIINIWQFGCQWTTNKCFSLFEEAKTFKRSKRAKQSLWCWRFLLKLFKRLFRCKSKPNQIKSNRTESMAHKILLDFEWHHNDKIVVRMNINFFDIFYSVHSIWFLQLPTNFFFATTTNSDSRNEIKINFIRILVL